MKVSFHFQKKISLLDRNQLKQFIENLVRAEKRKLYQIAVIFCSDKQLLEINRSFLKHDYFTDIITFEFSKPGDSIESEIYISVDTVKKNAKEYEVSITHELHRVIFHGVLHLCGYKDKTEAQQKEMQNAENKYLKKYFG